MCHGSCILSLERDLFIKPFGDRRGEFYFLSSTSIYKKKQDLVLVGYRREPCVAEEACSTEPPVIVITCFWLML